MPQVSIIVLTYNPDEAKLKQTLQAAAAQQGLSFEILISDDGSQRKDYSFLNAYMETLGVTDYTLLEHDENKGTVQSCLQAVRAARGEYVFLTSPGDLLFDSTVLRDFYRFAQEARTPLCFGNAVFYTSGKDGPRRSRKFGTPATPQVYVPGASRTEIMQHFFCGAWIIGASYFRSRELALETFCQIADVSKYMEDTPSTAFALAAGNSLCYFDRNMVWYEDGTGVSTGASEKWKKLLLQDLSGSLAKLKQQFPKNPYVDIAYRNATEPNKWKRIAGKLLCHPMITARLALQKKKAPKPIVCTDADLQRLTQQLQNR